ncbi:hypothetical protein IC582_001835 [Cucumis melo]|uniref:Non-specific lipid-transfer protein-like protein n=2 Tax=Cucumis melo TaxID=3656 RepID=A0A5D3D3P8_CUCMM|nr:non-specific lipid transfer protein GPI-anchored 20-like [Cucumis melo]KAA0040812.1 non-specific lipid-transfer protein-like protein [Cucumis melo var. makuwa]TYK17789.1 non-specific lipid-transfer protein-like protein [Cucumis melo var. makuwa]
MKFLSPFFLLLAFALVAIILPVNGQMNMSCSASMVSSFSPCLNFVTNSSANGTSPTADCCNAIRSLASGGRDCLCLIVTGGVPFQIPINRTLAISLPRACNLPGVPIQCNAATAPASAPASIPLGPSLSPQPSPTASPQAPEPTTPALTPSSPVVPEAEAPSETGGSRPVLTPSSAVPSNSFPDSFLLMGLAFVILKI